MTSLPCRPCRRVRPETPFGGHSLYWEGPWRGADDLELAALGWVDWFNHTRIHSSLGYLTPAQIEAEYYRHINAVEQPLPAELTV